LGTRDSHGSSEGGGGEVVEEKTAPSGLRFEQGRGEGVVGDKRRPLRLASSEEGVGWW